MEVDSIIFITNSVMFKLNWVMLLVKFFAAAAKDFNSKSTF